MSIVGTPYYSQTATGDTYTPGAGSSRIIAIIAVTIYGTSNSGSSSGLLADRQVTLGGVAGAELGHALSTFTGTSLQIIKEADIPASPANIVLGSEVENCLIYTLAGVDQIDTVLAGSVIEDIHLSTSSWSGSVSSDGTDVLLAVGAQNDTRGAVSATGLTLDGQGSNGTRRVVGLSGQNVAGASVSWGITWTNNQIGSTVGASFNLDGSPVLSDINTNNEVVPGTTATITGINLTSATGVTIGGVSQSAVTVVNDTTVTFTVVRGGNPYNQDLTAEITGSNGSATITAQQIPESGTFAVTAFNPNTVDDASLWTGLVDTGTSNPITIVDGDQAWVKNPNNLTNLAITPQGQISSDQTGDFVVQIWLASEGVWGSDQTVTFTLSDAVAPTVTSVSVPTAGSYGSGQSLDFTVNSSEVATVTTTGGTPSIPVTVGANVRQATYVSGSGTASLLFRYTTQAGDNDADGIAVGSSIALNGGTIQDGAGNNLVLTLNSVGATTGILVDTVKPVITPIGANPATVVVGDTYTDAGFTAFDDQDGSLGTVTGTGTVDTNTIGQYTITASGAGVVDSAGNVADDATRIVNVVAELPVEPVSGRAIGFRNSIRAAVRDSVGTSIH